jgi:hypothetical protein
MSSFGAWCGAWQAPGVNHRKKGLVGAVARRSLMNSVALSTMSSVRWYPSSGVHGGSTKWLSYTSSGWYWSVSPPMKP